MSTTTIPEPTALAKQSTDLHQQIMDHTVDSEQSAADMSTLLKIVKGLKTKVNETFDPVIASTHASWKSALAAKKTHFDPLEWCDSIGRRKLGDYQMAEERKRREEMQRKQREAEAAEAERREREAAVEREKIAEQRKAADAAKRAGDEARAKELREQANKQAAEVRAVAAAPIVVAVAAPPPVPKVEGVTVRMVPDFEILDASKLPAKYLLPDEKAIRKVVAALGVKAEIPGVRVFMKPATSVR